MSPILLFAFLLLPILLPELLVNARDAGDTNYKWHLTGGLYCYDLENEQAVPMSNVKIELWEHDTWYNGWKDDHLDDTVVNEAKFELRGSEDENGVPEPYIRIWHNCNDATRKSWPSYVTKVWLKPEEEEQKLYIYLGKDEHADFHETGKDDLPLRMETNGSKLEWVPSYSYYYGGKK